MKKNILVKPVLKWVGGKRQLLKEIIPLIPNHTTYVEAFVGGGAIWFDMQPKKAVICDLNDELINVYKTIKAFPEQLIEALNIHDNKNTEDYFYEIRELDRKKTYLSISQIEKAARIIYLNKTCFNGLYRVNSSGEFNTPYGKYKNPNIINEPTIRAISLYINSNNIKFLSGDYSNALKGLRKGAFVYFDPPYVPISTSSSFTGYTEGGFSIKQQENLKIQCDKLSERGIKIMQSNSDCDFIRSLYQDYNIVTVQANRSINSNGNKRGAISEVLIMNYEE